MNDNLEKAQAALTAAGQIASEIDEINKNDTLRGGLDGMKAKEHDFNRLMDIAAVQASIAQAAAMEAMLPLLHQIAYPTSGWSGPR